MDKARFLEMTSRARSESQCQELRMQLKEWEKAFADANSGRKPGKQDIKDDRSISAKYRTYNRTRDFLDGKVDAEGLPITQSSSPSYRTKAKSTTSVKTKTSRRHTTGDRIEPVATPKKPRLQLPASHPSVLDPYDTSLVVSPSPRPYAFKNAVGPTPERDGKVLGLFDMLSQSGSTPSTRKRKASCLNANFGGVDTAQTPSRRQRVLGQDVHGDMTGGRRHSRTPISEGRKFLLSQFFATPGTVRFADVGGSDIPGQRDMTPIRTKTSGAGAKGTGVNASESAVDATPAFLKRSTSFNQRLRTASQRNEHDANGDPALGFTSPAPVRRVPSTRSFKGKPLSEILRGLRQMEDENNYDNEEEDMEALREIENNEVSTAVVADSQSGVGVSGEGQPPRVWKKRGQKRTTRRVIMKPSVKIRKADAEEAESRQSSSEEEVERVGDTQLGRGARQPPKTVKNDNANDSDPDAAAESSYSTDFNLSDLEDLDELATTTTMNTNPHKPKPNTKSPTITIDIPSKNDPATKRDAKGSDKPDASKTSRKEEKKATKTANKKKDEKERKTTAKVKTINPNAVAHANFRSLKIRSRGSKGRGGGRFGRGRR